jgi:hypothetical protein
MERKVFDFGLKELNEDGTFQGYASIFRPEGECDLAGDRIEKGAFKITLKKNGSFPLHWYHNILEPVGEITPEEDDIGLKVEGKLVLEVQRAAELYALMRKTKRVAKQLSIGYEAVKWRMDGGTRVIKEIKLYEISIVTFGADQAAFISEIKIEGKPYPNEHACRLQDPDKYDRFTREKRKHEGKTYSIIFGWRKVEGKEVSEEQAYRYDKDVWTAAEARTHCKDHDGSFEAASKSIEGILEEVVSWKDSCCIHLTDEQKDLAIKAIETLKVISLDSEGSRPDIQDQEVSDLSDSGETHLLKDLNSELEKLNESLRR